MQQSMIYRRSAEQFLAELAEILHGFQTHVATRGREGPAREEALFRLRKLGFTSGEALGLLRKARRGRD
jgi:hypothetical protein